MANIEPRVKPPSVASGGTERSDVRLARVVTGLALSSIVPALAAVGHPPDALGALILLLYVPMIVAQHWLLPRALSGVAPALTIGANAWWGIANALPMRAAPAARLFPVVLVVGLLGMGFVDRSVQERTNYRYFAFTIPLVWSTVWFLMSSGPSGTIGQPAHSLYRYPSLIQPVSVVGGLGLNLLILLANWTGAALVLSALGHPCFGAQRARRMGVVIAAVGSFWVGVSLLLLEEPTSILRVAAVQPGLRSANLVSLESSLERYKNATRRAAANGAKLIVWPEGALRFDPAVTETDRLRGLARETGAYIALGYWVSTPSVGARNEAIIVTPHGELMGPYAKQHPITLIGERSDSDYGYPVFDTSLGRIALLICYDLDYLDTPRAMARQGAGLIAVPSHDWSEIAEMHYTGFVLRAIENRVTLIKADKAWDSAIIDPYGRLLARKVDKDGSAALLTADVPIGSARSPAVALGDLNGLVMVVATLVLLLILSRSALRVHRQSANGATRVYL